MAEMSRSEELLGNDGDSLSKAHGKIPGPHVSISSSASSYTKAGKKKSSFTANTISSKRRPVMTRRKSSQSSSGNTSKVPSPRLVGQTKPPAGSTPPSASRISLSSGQPGSNRSRSVQIDNGDKPSTPHLPIEAEDDGPISRPNRMSPTTTRASHVSQSARASRSASPASYRSFYQPSLGDLAQVGKYPERGSDHPPPLQDWLVDRDFRSKFVSRVQPARVRAGVNRVPATVAVPGGLVATVEGSSGKGKGKEKGKGVRGAGGEKGRVGGGGGIQGFDTVDDNDDDVEDGEGEMTTATLPRTKSQISLLIEEDRRRKSDSGRGGERDKDKDKDKGKKRS